MLRHSFHLQICMQILFDFVLDPLGIFSLYDLLRIYDKIIRCLYVQKKKERKPINLQLFNHNSENAINKINLVLFDVFLTVHHSIDFFKLPT